MFFHSDFDKNIYLLNWVNARLIDSFKNMEMLLGIHFPFKMRIHTQEFFNYFDFSFI